MRLDEKDNDNDMTYRNRYIRRITIFLATVLAVGSVMAQSSGGSSTGVVIKGNVYGGGNLGDVGKITKSADLRTFEWVNGTGVCEVSIISSTAVIEGIVFGAGKGEASTFECEKAIVHNSSVSIENGTVKGNVYGGGEVGRVETDTEVLIGLESEPAEGVTIAPHIVGSVYGAGAGVGTHGYSALVRGNTKVTIKNKAEVGKSVYGGGEIASVGNYGLKNGYPSILLAGGECVVNVQGEAEVGTNTDDGGNVFGASKGIKPPFNKTNVDKTKRSRRMMKRNGNEATLFPDDKEIKTSSDLDLENKTWEYIKEYTDAEKDDSHIIKYVWEYFKEESKYLNFLETLALATRPIVTINEDASVNGSVFGGGELGITKGSVFVNILGGTIEEDVYGGGALADTNTTSEVGDTDTDGKPLPADESGNYSTHTVHPTTAVKLTGGVIKGDAYGGGLGDADTPAYVYGNITFDLNGETTTTTEGGKTVYGTTPIGGSETTTTKGCVVNRIFGCNNLNGSPKGDVLVHIHATQNANATQIGNTAASGETPAVNGKIKGSYDVMAVYGGGNLAAYEPFGPNPTETSDDGKNTTKSTNVIIDGCDLTSIKQVYGGGNAASTPATEVTINGTYEIDEVFGGGNGKDAITVNGVEMPNPGANVGFYDYSAVEPDFPTKADRQATTFTEKYVYGSGKAAVNINGGRIHCVFGGSNTKGNVRVTAVAMLEEVNDETGVPCCAFDVDEAYGGGKSAPMDAEAKLLMACIPGLKEAYGGAEDADIIGNVNLTITNGTFGRVFGGNNLSGTISGSITVNIEETGCKPIIIGELYGGGNEAGYSIHGYKQVTTGVGDEAVTKLEPRTSATDGNEVNGFTTAFADPEVNIKSFTSIGDVFGGGYGETAVMVGSPTVNIHVVADGETEAQKKTYTAKVTNPETGEETGEEETRYYSNYAGGTMTIGGHSITLPSHTKGKVGAIQNVFGGGNAAKVIGSTTVNIGTKATEDYVSNFKGENAPKTGLTVTGADIRGNVYGGGNNADVTGSTKVTIGKETTTTPGGSGGGSSGD